MKLCIDCTYMGPAHFGQDGSDLTRCLRLGETKPGVSPVTGQPYRERVILFCEIQRNSGTERACGPMARYFEPKQGQDGKVA